MSMPAVGAGRIYMAYPDSKGDRRHYLACFDLRTGHEYWKQPIAGEIITAPVLAGGKVHFATLDGTLYCLRQEDGGVEWQEPRNATSSPVVWEGECFFSQRQEVAAGDPARPDVHQAEHLAARAMRDARYRNYAATARKADYLDHAKRVRGSPRYAASQRADSAVGFGAFKGDAKMAQAMHNLGKGHIHEVWTYQGSKPFVSRGRLYAAQGDTVTSADPRSDQVYWKTRLGTPQAEDEDLLDSLLTPPAIANGKLFIGTAHGEVHCLSAESGTTLWSVPIGEPIVFQPAVVAGRVYIGTDSGTLICLETGDDADDGWQMWGADAAHNGRID
jgi:outer membrane protein assembly factor BamB